MRAGFPTIRARTSFHWPGARRSARTRAGPAWETLLGGRDGVRRVEEVERRDVEARLHVLALDPPTEHFAGNRSLPVPPCRVGAAQVDAAVPCRSRCAFPARPRSLHISLSVMKSRRSPACPGGRSAFRRALPSGPPSCCPLVELWRDWRSRSSLFIDRAVEDRHDGSLPARTRRCGS